jgi:hypothetical protein
MLHKVALMAHLLVDPDAEPMWTEMALGPSEEDRPAALDMVTPVRAQYLDRLISLGRATRGHLDYSLFEASRIGQDEHEVCRSFDPSHAEFESGEELLGMKTTWINKHDELLANLDASGGNLPIGPERRKLCFDNFVGPHGRCKNLALYYCFILWEGKELRFLTRRLDGGACVTSTGGTDGSGGLGGSYSSKKESLSSKDKKTIAMYSAMMSPSVSAESERANVDLVKKRARAIVTKESAMQAAKLGEGMNHPMYQNLSLEKQKEIQDKWFEQLMK